MGEHLELVAAARSGLWAEVARRRAAGTTLVLASHHPAELEHLVDEVLLLEFGEVLERGHCPRSGTARRRGGWGWPDGAPTDRRRQPDPPILLRETGRRLRPGEALYRLYLTVLFGGMYGGTLVHAIVTAPTLTSAELTQLGLVLTRLPGAAALAGIHLGSWVGLVSVAPAEAAVLLPTPVRRRILLRPRALRAVVVLVALLAITALAATVLLALQRTLTAAAWLAGPLGAAALAQLATSLLQAPDPWPVVTVTLIAGTVTAIAAAGAIRHLDGLHDEELRARAGLHAGLGASLRLGDLRAVRLSRDPGSRSRTGHRLALPSRAAGVVRWRHLVAHRARPGGLVRVVVGWGLATALVVGPEPPSTWTAAVLRVLVAGGLAYAATVPLVEPMRRDHDAPLAAELLPFGYAHLQRLPVRACLAIGLVVIVPTAALAQLVLAPQQLADASAPKPGSSLPIAWRRLRARRGGDGRRR